MHLLQHKLYTRMELPLQVKFHFAESFDEPGGKGAFEMRHSFLYLFSLVRIS